MDACLPDWNTDLAAEVSSPLQRKTLGLESELVELLWQNGEIVLHSQTNKKQSCDPTNKSKQVRDPTSLIQDDETSLWIDCPIDESFEREFCSDLLSELPSFDESHKPSEKSHKFGSSEVNHVVPTSHSPRQEFVPLPLPPPRFQAKKQGVEHESSGVSRMTIGSSNCASNQVMDVSWASSCGIGACSQSLNKGVERETLGQADTSCSARSGSSLWRTTSSQSHDTNNHKRKSHELEESECPSDATESESPAGNKATTRRTRVAEVHNLSEKKRRDRINEKMKALQELIPHSNKSDKASMLDEAIEYMKSLQLQIQLMWMGRGMGPMMFPGMQPYTPRGGMAMLPAFQTRGVSPLANYQAQMQNYMALYSMQNNTPSPQATNAFNFGLQQNEAAAPKRNGNRSSVG